MIGGEAADGGSGAVRLPGSQEKALGERYRRELRWAGDWQAAILAVEAAGWRLAMLVSERENRLDRITGLSRGSRLAAERNHATGRYPVRSRAAERRARQTVVWRATQIAAVRARYADRMGRIVGEETEARRRLGQAAREALALWATDELARRWTGTNRSRLHRLGGASVPITAKPPQGLESSHVQGDADRPLLTHWAQGVETRIWRARESGGRMGRRLTIPDDWNSQIRARYESERTALGAHHAATVALATAERRRSEVLAGLDAAVAAAAQRSGPHPRLPVRPARAGRRGRPRRRRRGRHPPGHQRGSPERNVQMIAPRSVTTFWVPPIVVGVGDGVAGLVGVSGLVKLVLNVVTFGARSGSHRRP